MPDEFFDIFIALILYAGFLHVSETDENRWRDGDGGWRSSGRKAVCCFNIRKVTALRKGPRSRWR